jgi:LuxR family maltose regulon positive regulatory protein
VIEDSPGRAQLEAILVLRRAAIEAGEHGPALPSPLRRRATPLETQIDRWLVQAAESIRTGDSTRSSLQLKHALRLAAPEHLRRPFSDAPAELERLFQPGGELMRRHTWLRTPGPQHARAADQSVRRARYELVVTITLSSKEREVLTYLAELLTTEEIAGTMHVSVNTVRSHVRSILRKLSASRRNEAVRRAWDLGLLPQRPEA